MFSIDKGNRNDSATVRQQHINCPATDRNCAARNSEPFHWSLVGSVRPEARHFVHVHRILLHLPHAHRYRLHVHIGASESLVVFYGIPADRIHRRILCAADRTVLLCGGCGQPGESGNEVGHNWNINSFVEIIVFRWDDKFGIKLYKDSNMFILVESLQSY